MRCSATPRQVPPVGACLRRMMGVLAALAPLRTFELLGDKRGLGLMAVTIR